MPVQTKKKANVFFPDGAKVQVQAQGDTEWYDVGAINSAVTATLNWTESTVETANAGTLDTRVSGMEMAGGFTLINLDPVGVGKMSGGALSIVEVPGTATTAIANQVLRGVVAGRWYTLELISNDTAEKTRTDGTKYKIAGTRLHLGAGVAKPVITSVTAAAALTEDTDYTIIRDDEGFKIKFVANADEVTIVYGSNTPVASTSVVGGASTVVLKPYAMRIEHTDDNGLVRSLELYAVYSGSGGFQFNFKGANEDGVEEMPLTFTGRLDISRDSGKQLFAWTVENGAA